MFQRHIYHVIPLLLVLLHFTFSQRKPPQPKPEVSIGAFIHHEESHDVSYVFDLAVDEHKHTESEEKESEDTLFSLQPYKFAQAPARRDLYSLQEGICKLGERGLHILFVASKFSTYPTISTASKRLNVPVANRDGEFKLGDLSLSVRPQVTQMVIDVILRNGWRQVSFLYDNLEGLEFLQKLVEEMEKRTEIRLQWEPHVVDTNKPINSNYSFFKQFHRMRSTGKQHVILAISSAQIQADVLKNLAAESAKTRNFHYLVARHELTQSDIELFKDGLVNVTGFRLMRPNSQLTQFQNKHKMQHKMSADAALTYDLVTVIKKGMTTLFENNDDFHEDAFGAKPRWQSGHDCDKQRGLKMKHAKKIMKYLKGVSLNGLSGWVQFDKTGKRYNYTVDVVDLTFTDKTNILGNVRHEVTEWNDRVGFGEPQLQANTSVGEGNGRRKKIRVTTIMVEPFIMLRRRTDKDEEKVFEGNERYEGYCVDLLEKLGKVLNARSVIPDFDYEIRPVRDGSYGSPRDDGKWDGMIGELLRDQADMAVASLTITKARERVVDFSKPFLTLGISIMIKKPDKQEFSVFSFMSPLSQQIWIFIVLSFLCVSFVIFIVSRFSPYEWRVEESPNGGLDIKNDFTISNCMWFTGAAFLQQGIDILPKSISARIASSAWWFFTMIIVSSYTANLAAFLTLEKMQTPIGSVEDLATQDKIRYGIQNGGSTAEFFRDSSVEIYRKMWQTMSSIPSVFVQSYAEGIQRVRESKGRYAFLLESSANNYINNRKPCDTMKVGQNLNSVGYGIATPFGSKIRDKVNLAILELQERGELKRLENKWWYDKGECEQGRGDSHSQSLNLSKVAGIFYILIGGMVAAMVCSFCEYLFRSNSESTRARAKLAKLVASGPESSPSISLSRKARRENTASTLLSPEKTSTRDGQGTSSGYMYWDTNKPSAYGMNSEV